MVAPVSDIQAEEAISSIATAVGQALGAQCVILFGSRARGDHKEHSDVDLAVIVGESENWLTPQRRVDLEAKGFAVANTAGGGQFRHVDVRVWTEPAFRADKRSINHVAGRIWREGRVLFGCHGTLPGEETVAELPHVRELVEMAQGQLRTMNVLNNPDVREEDFGFHAERATELALKAWIAMTGEQYRLTHILHQLFDQLEEAGASDTRQFRDLTSLTNYAVVYQYQRIQSPVMDRGRVIADVRSLVDFVAALLERAELEQAEAE